MAAKKQFYAVVKGRNPGIYTRWTGAGGAEEQVSGFAGAVFRGFATKAEADAFLASGGAKAPAARKPAPGKTLSAAENRQSSDKHQAAPADAPLPFAGDSAPAPARRVPAAVRRAQEELAEGKVVIYTDGASTGNPGPGGYGVVILSGDQRKELSGGFRCTTNNRMEMMGVITALEALSGQAGSPVVVYSDSRYVVDALTKGWAVRWRRNGWMRTSDSPAENSDLWERLLRLLDARSKVEFHWVRGHASNPENERCDRLAVQAAHARALPADPGFTRKC